MKIRADRFCSLSTSPSWQAWLFHFDVTIYRRFIRRLQESRGCNQNREIMVELLKEIEAVDGGLDKLMEFLGKHYPHMIVGDAKPATVAPANNVFPDFNPDILTYPHRRVFENQNRRELEKEVKGFLVGKAKSDFVISDGRAYVEYLEQSEADLPVPLKSWLIAAWRSKHKS